MASAQTPVSTSSFVYSDSADETSGARKRVIEDIIYSIDPKVLPLRDWFGGYSKLPVKSIKIGFIEDSHIAITTAMGTVSGSDWNNAADTSALTVADGDIFAIGDVVLTADGELVVVSDVDESGNTIDVYGRGDLGSTESNANTTGDTLTIVGNSQLEGFTYGASPRFNLRINKVHYTQIFTDTAQVSKSYEETPQYGIKSLFSHQIAQKTLRQAKLFERACLYGSSNVGTLEGNASHPRTMCGMLSPSSVATEVNIQTNTQSLSSVELTEAHLNTQIQAIYDNGSDADPDTIMVNSFNKKVVSDFQLPYRRTDFSDKKYGTVVDTIFTDFGEMNLLLNRYMRQSDVIILPRKNFRMGSYRPFHQETLPNSKDVYWSEILGEMTACLTKEEDCAWIYSTATS